jgi:ribosomal protein S27AE
MRGDREKTGGDIDRLPTDGTGENEPESVGLPAVAMCPASPPEIAATTALNVPPEMAWYAKAHGAGFDKHHGCWFVSGDIPPELANFLPKPSRPAITMQQPFCPRCGTHMIKHRSRYGEFWRCSAFGRTECKGSLSLEKHLDLLEQTVAPRVDEILHKSMSGGPSTPQRDERPSRAVPPTDLADEVKEIARLAQGILGNDAATWLQRPKLGLGNQAPVTMMRTAEGRQSVVHLLLDMRKYGLRDGV